MRAAVLLMAVLVLSSCAYDCEKNERNKPGYPWSDVEHLGVIGLPDVVAPEPFATIERAQELTCP